MCSNPLILNQGELTIYCLFIGMKYSSFNSQYISNAKRLFYETLSPKKHGQVCLDRKDYYDALPVSFTANTPDITTATHIGGGYLFCDKYIRGGLPQVYIHHLVFCTGELLMLE